VVVDTHVMRVSQRLGWSKASVADKIEPDLCAILPKSEWDKAGHVLIFHGRRVCFARKPQCAQCAVNDVCPSAFDADHVGRKQKRGKQKDQKITKPTKRSKKKPSRSS
jgi:endonuclease-3